MKKILGLISVLVIVLGLCGCADVLQENNISRGNITTKTTMDIEKQYFDNLLKDASIDTMDRMMLNNLKESMVVLKKDGKDYYRYQSTEKLSFSDYMYNSSEDDTVAYVTNEVFYEKESVGDMMSDDNTYLFDKNKIDYSKMNLKQTVTFDKEVVNTNGTINKDNKKQVNKLNFII